MPKLLPPDFDAKLLALVVDPASILLKGPELAARLGCSPKTFNTRLADLRKAGHSIPFRRGGKPRPRRKAGRGQMGQGGCPGRARFLALLDDRRNDRRSLAELADLAGVNPGSAYHWAYRFRPGRPKVPATGSRSRRGPIDSSLVAMARALRRAAKEDDVAMEPEFGPRVAAFYREQAEARARMGIAPTRPIAIAAFGKAVAS